MKKSNENKNNGQAGSDINGRIEYIDQSLRSVDNRMRAVEKRLSIKAYEPDLTVISPERCVNTDEVYLNEISEKLDELHGRLSSLERTTQETHANDMISLRSQLSLIENRIIKLENLNKITIGKIKVPIEFSGLAAVIVMFTTGYLIYNDHWNIVRSSYYPVAIGVLFGIVVIGKFMMTNRK